MGAVYRLHGDDFSQLGADAIRARLVRWEQTWAAFEATRARLVFRAVPMDLSEPIRRARRAEAGSNDETTIRHIRQYAGLLDQAAKSNLLGVEHYLVLPGLDGAEADAAADMLAAGLGVRAVPIPDLPPILPARYRVHSRLLMPEGNHPLCSILVSYDMAGRWDWTVLTKLLTLGFPIDLAVESLNHPGPAAYSKLDRAQGVLSGLFGSIGAKAALAKMTADFKSLMDGVQQGDALHQVGVAVLVWGRTEGELRERERQVSAALSGRVSVRRIDGMQGDLFRAFFTSVSRPAPPSRLLHNMTSAGLALVSGPLGLRRRANTEGVLWGLSGQVPFFWDGFGPELKEPNHGIVLGTTGSGKTVSVSAVALREINLMGSQVIVMEPMGNCRRLVNAVGPERSSYNPLSLRSLRVNPVEMLYEDPAEQAAHLMVVLTLLLGRKLTEEEEIALDSSIPLVYAGVTPDTPPVNQPRLENLARVLRSLGGERWMREAGSRLGSLLEERYVRGTRAAVFNVPTQSDWKMEQDLVAFDFAGLPEEEGLRRLGYYLVLSSIQREAFRQARSRRRIVMIDEFRVMSTEPVLAQRVATMFKTFRTLGVGVWALEQDVITFTGLDRASTGTGDVDVMAGLYMLANATFVVVLAQRPAGARLLPQQFPQLTEDHASYLMALNPQRNDGDKGRGLVILPDEVYPIRFELTQFELQMLSGS